MKKFRACSLFSALLGTVLYGFMWFSFPNFAYLLLWRALQGQGAEAPNYPDWLGYVTIVAFPIGMAYGFVKTRALVRHTESIHDDRFTRVLLPGGAWQSQDRVETF